MALPKLTEVMAQGKAFLLGRPARADTPGDVEAAGFNPQPDPPVDGASSAGLRSDGELVQMAATADAAYEVKLENAQVAAHRLGSAGDEPSTLADLSASEGEGGETDIGSWSKVDGLATSYDLVEDADEPGDRRRRA